LDSLVNHWIGYVVGIAVGLVCFHFGLRWYFALIAAWAAFALASTIALILFAIVTSRDGEPPQDISHRGSTQ
jgi:hypothetical protein